MVLDPKRSDVAYVVVDRDDPDAASGLLEIDVPTGWAIARRGHA